MNLKLDRQTKKRTDICSMQESRKSEYMSNMATIKCLIIPQQSWSLEALVLKCIQRTSG